MTDHISSLPIDVLQSILLYCSDLTFVCKCRRISKHLQQVIDSSSLWISCGYADLSAYKLSSVVGRTQALKRVASQLLSLSKVQSEPREVVVDVPLQIEESLTALKLDMYAKRVLRHLAADNGAVSPTQSAIAPFARQLLDNYTIVAALVECESETIGARVRTAFCVRGVKLLFESSYCDRNSSVYLWFSQSAPDTREKCRYADKCYRKNEQHRQIYLHPGDAYVDDVWLPIIAISSYSMPAAVSQEHQINTQKLKAKLHFDGIEDMSLIALLTMVAAGPDNAYGATLALEQAGGTYSQLLPHIPRPAEAPRDTSCWWAGIRNTRLCPLCHLYRRSIAGCESCSKPATGK